MSNDSTSDFSDKLSRLVDDAKHNTQWRKQFMDLEIEKIYSFRAGKAEGAQEKAIEDAENLLKEGDSPEKVARCIGLPLEQVLELKKSNRFRLYDPKPNVRPISYLKLKLFPN